MNQSYSTERIIINVNYLLFLLFFYRTKEVQHEMLIQKKYIIAFVILILFLIYAYKSTFHQSSWYGEIFSGSSLTCKERKVINKCLIWLSNTIQDVFKIHNFSSFLIYGSVWGPLRGYKGPMLWDGDVDYGALMKDFNETKMEAIAFDLRLHNISTRKKMEQSSQIIFSHSSNLEIDLYFFKETWFGMARRSGWEIFLAPIHHYYFHSFAYRLIADVEQLPIVRFGDRDTHTPRGGIEIMKYLYRDSWKTELKPKGYDCYA